MFCKLCVVLCIGCHQAAADEIRMQMHAAICGLRRLDHTIASSADLCVRVRALKRACKLLTSQHAYHEAQAACDW